MIVLVTIHQPNWETASLFDKILLLAQGKTLYSGPMSTFFISHPLWLISDPLIHATGVITYSTNLNTSALVEQLTSQHPNPRLILETDAPFMIPANIYSSLKECDKQYPLRLVCYRKNAR